MKNKGQEVLLRIALGGTSNCMIGCPGTLSRQPFTWRHQAHAISLGPVGSDPQREWQEFIGSLSIIHVIVWAVQGYPGRLAIAGTEG